MDKEQTKQCIAVMQAYVDGEAILRADGIEINDPAWNWSGDAGFYKVKPKPTYRPFTPVEAAAKLGERLKPKPLFVCDSGLSWVFAIHSSSVKLNDRGGFATFAELLERWTFEDGSPCGVPVTDAPSS